MASWSRKCPVSLELGAVRGGGGGGGLSKCIWHKVHMVQSTEFTRVKYLCGNLWFVGWGGYGLSL